MLLLEFRNVIRPVQRKYEKCNSDVFIRDSCSRLTIYIGLYPVSVSTYHLRTIENTLLVNCVLMCFMEHWPYIG